MVKEGIGDSSGYTRTPKHCIGARQILEARMSTSRVQRAVRGLLDDSFLLIHTYLCFFAAFIEGVRSVLDPNPMPPGLYQYSVVVSTPQREMKITAPTKERHDIWLNVSQVCTRPRNRLLTHIAGTSVFTLQANT